MDPEARFNVWKQGFDKRIEEDGNAGDTKSETEAKEIRHPTSTFEVDNGFEDTTTVSEASTVTKPNLFEADSAVADNSTRIEEWLEGLKVDTSPFQEPSPSSPKRRTSKPSDDDVPSALWNAMMEVEKSRKRLKKDRLYYETGKLGPLFGVVTEKAEAVLKKAVKNTPEYYPKAKEMLKNWNKFSSDAALFNNRLSQNIAEVIRGLCDARFGCLGDKFEYSWTESCRSPEDIQEKFMADCPFELKLIKGYGKPWGEYYRQQKLAKAKEVFEFMNSVSQYESKMNQFLDNKFCVNTEELDVEIVKIMDSMKVPSEALKKKLEAIISDLYRQFSERVTRNITSENVNVQKAIDHACAKYEGLMEAKTSDYLDPAELQRLHEETYSKIVEAFESVSGFEYTDIWRWPEEQPEQVSMHYVVLESLNEIKLRTRKIEQLTALLNTMDPQEKFKIFEEHCPELVQNLSSNDDRMTLIKTEEADLNLGRRFSGTSATTHPLEAEDDKIEILEETPTSNASNCGLSLHFSEFEILACWNYRDPNGFSKKKTLGPYPGSMALAKNRDFLTWRSQGGLQIQPSNLVSEHGLVTSNMRKFWSHQNWPDNDDLFAEELLALILKKILDDIRIEFEVDPLDACVAVTVPAMAHPACRQRLKTALQLVGWKNSVIVHMSTAIALSFRNCGPQNTGYQAVTVFIRSGLAEVAVFHIIGDHAKMIAVRSSTAVPKVAAKSIPQIAAETAKLIKRMLQGASIPVSEIHAAFIVSNTRDVNTQKILELLKTELGSNMKCFRRSSIAGIMPGLSDLSIAKLPREMFDEVFPWNILVDYGIDRKRHLVHVFDKAVCRGTRIPVSSISDSFKVFLVDFEQETKTLCLSLENARGISDWWSKPSVTVQVSSEGLVTLNPGIVGHPEAKLINYNMQTNVKRLRWSQKRIEIIEVVRSKFRPFLPKLPLQRFTHGPPDGDEPEAKRGRFETPEAWGDEDVELY